MRASVLEPAADARRYRYIYIWGPLSMLSIQGHKPADILLFFVASYILQISTI